MERRYLFRCELPYTQACCRPSEVGKQVFCRPSGVAGSSPAVVVGAAAPKSDAAVVSRATANHPGALECVAGLPGGSSTGVRPVVGGGYDTAIEELSRPALFCKGAVVGAGLQEQYRLVATFSHETRYGSTGSAATDDYCVRVAGKLRGMS